MKSRNFLLVAVTLLTAAPVLALGAGPAPAGGGNVGTPVSAWVVLIGVVTALAIAMRQALTRDRRAAVAFAAVGTGAIAAAASLPIHAVGAFALLAACYAVTRRAAPVLVGAALVALSVPMGVSESMAVANAFVVDGMLQLLGVAHGFDATAFFFDNGTVTVDPACAAVEGAAVAAVLTLTIRSLTGETGARPYAVAVMHALAFLVANVARILVVALAMTGSLGLAELAHGVGGIALLAVHLPFLWKPVRALMLQSRALRVPAVSSTRVPAIAIAIASLAASQANATDYVFPIAGAPGVEEEDVATVNANVVGEARLGGFATALDGKPAGNNQAAALQALKATGKGRVLSGVLRPDAADDTLLVLELFIEDDAGQVLVKVKTKPMLAKEAKHARSATKAAIGRVGSAAPAPAPAPVAAPAPVPAPAPVAAPAPAEAAPAPAAEEPAAAEPAPAAEEAQQGPSMILPISLGIGAVVAGGGAIGAGLWAQSDVEALRTGKASDAAGTESSAKAKGVTSDVLTVTAIGLGVGAAVLGTMAFMTPAAE